MLLSISTTARWRILSSGAGEVAFLGDGGEVRQRSSLTHQRWSGADRHISRLRRIFATEGLTVALAGWLVGIPLGFGLAHAVVTLAENTFNQHVLSRSRPSTSRSP